MRKYMQIAYDNACHLGGEMLAFLSIPVPLEVDYYLVPLWFCRNGSQQ